MEKLKIGIIGGGWVAQVFHLPLLTKNIDAEVTALCDKDKSKLKSVGEKFGIRQLYTNVEEMLASEKLNAVTICTPTDTHKSIAVAALNSGLDVFVERPIARKYDEAVDIAETVHRTKQKLMVGMNNRFRPDLMMLKSIIENGELGEIFYLKAAWVKKLGRNNPWFTQKEKSGGGVFLDLGLGALDTLLWAVNFNPVKRVSAITYNHTTKSVEDSCIAFIETKNGATLHLETSWSFHITGDAFSCEIYGTKGSAQLNPLRINKTIGGDVIGVTPVKSETLQNILKKSYELELKHFIGAIKCLHPVISTADEAVQRMKVVEAVYKSAKLKKEIVLK